MKEIVVSGCSFSDFDYSMFDEERYIKYGFNPDELPFEIPKYDCWPILLGRQLDKKVINLSVTGSGNYAICKRAQDYIINNHKNIDTCIIALTEWHRVEDVFLNGARGGRYVEMEAFLKDLENDYDKKYFYGIFKHNGEMLSVDCETGDKKDIYDNQSKLIYSTLRSIYELQNLCNKLNVNCVFFQMLKPMNNLVFRSFSSIQQSKTTEKILKSIFSNPYFNFINTEYTIGWPFFTELNGFSFFEKYLTKEQKNFIGHTMIPTIAGFDKQKVKDLEIDKEKPKYVLERVNDWHPSQKGHQLISDLVIKKLERMKLV